MKFKALLISVFLLFLSTSMQVLAQDKPAIQQIVESQLPKALPYFVQNDAASQFRTQRLGNTVRDLDAGVLRAKYRITGYDDLTSSSPEVAAKTYLTTVQQEFGFTAELDDLSLLDIKPGSHSTHVTYQQSYSGLPVYGRFVKVNLNREELPTMIFSGYAPHLAHLTDFDAQPRYSANAAQREISTLLNQENLQTTAAQLVVYPSATPRLAWKIIAWPEVPALELEILVDAQDGTIIKIQNTSTHLRHESPHPIEVKRKDTIIEQSSSAIHSVGSITGKGLVFDPDPLTTANQFYGSPYIDNNDGDSDEINAQRLLVDLPDISQGQNGMYHLIGPHVQIVPESSGGTDIYAPPAELTPDGFKYTRSNNFFEAVNVYYHIDKSQRYLQSLNIGRDIQNLSIRVNPHGLGLEDNSRYFANQNYIAFGQGGVDDAEDAQVVWHEYGHALLQGSAPGLLGSTEGQALHEGWADYWAASYTRSLVDDNIIPREDWRTLFKWDSGEGSIWQGREMVFTGKYPDDTFCDSGGFQCNIYDDGIMWATTLMDVYDTLGRSVTDRLSLASHAYLVHPVSFRDAAEAIIQADADLNASVHVAFLIQIFSEKGLLDISNFGPLALHDEVPSTEQLGGSIPITVNATAISAPIDRVSVFYTVDDGSQEALELTATSENTYSVQLPLPDVSSEISYFIEVEDELGLISRLPASDFLTYSFSNGPDNEPPTIQHIQHPSVTLVDWPAQLVATAADNLGIDVVEVFFLIHDSQGNQVLEDTFSLTLEENEYRGVFPVSIETLEPGSTVSYKLIARDISSAGNETHLPASNYYVFNIIIEGGVFRQYNFETETQGIAATGSWQRGEPAYGLEFAYSDANLWATNPSAAYPATAQHATLELPPMNLIGIPEAHLIFWQWHDTEHDGNATPDTGPNTILWDGGNIKVSVDGGVSWNILEPTNGYNGTIASGRENPLGGEPAFGGYSFGWRQVVAPLPVGSELRLRFDFGTDAGNTEPSVFYAGWHIDDISVLIEQPVDTHFPTATILPQLVAVRDPGQTPPEPHIELFDSTGVESVFVDYAFLNDASIPDGSFRLPMSISRKEAFSASFPFAESASLQVGDVLTYRFRVRDFAGNTAIFPVESESPFAVEYRLRDRINLFEQITASGIWQTTEDQWEISLSEEHKEISSLVFGPLDLPENVDNLQMLLFYEHSFIDNHGGNVKLSIDNANSWDVITPIDGYNGFLSDVETIPQGMRGQAAITGARSGLQQAVFDLLDHKGKQIWVRSDFGAQSKLATGEFWRIKEAALVYSTLEAVDGAFDIPRRLALHANYPDPFSASTTVSYTLSQATSVKLDVYDVLGRRITSLVDQEQAAGTYTLSMDGSTLSNGLYLLRLETNQGSQIERMVVAR